MPVYTYRCENCGVQFEKTQKFSDSPLTVCPECGKKSLHKVYTPVGIVFKGSGFYATDNRSPSGAPRPGSHSEHDHSESKPGSTAASTTSSAGEGTTSTAPAAAPSAKSD